MFNTKQLYIYMFFLEFWVVKDMPMVIPAILEKYHWTYLDVGKNHIINYN